MAGNADWLMRKGRAQSDAEFMGQEAISQTCAAVAKSVEK